jgi:uncharacterized protein
MKSFMADRIAKPRSSRIRMLQWTALLLCPMLVRAQQVPPKPNPPRLVNDLAGVLVPAQTDALEKKLDAYSDSTSTQLAIVLVPTVGDQDMMDYAVKLGRSWGVGGSKFSNGLVLLVAVNDHKVFIATGYGLEGALPDATCKEIIDNDIVPEFRAGDYYSGLDKGINDIIAAAAGEYQGTPAEGSGKGGKGWLGVVFIVFLFLFVISRISRGGGTLFSRGGGMLWAAPFLLGGGGGGGFGGGGGGGGGGGFGGFGGGSFGGGGAGGGW